MGNCVGILALNSGQGATGPSGAGQYRIEDNKVTANNQACPANDGPPTSGIGVALVGVQGVKVLDNEVTNNKPSGPSLASGGHRHRQGATSPPSNNLVKDNELRGNQPAAYSGIRRTASRYATTTATRRFRVTSAGANHANPLVTQGPAHPPGPLSWKVL